MARIIGVDLPQNKQVQIALTYIYGIGITKADEILKATMIKPDRRVKDLSGVEINKIVAYIEANLKVEGALRQEIQSNIRRLKNIKTYRGVRHLLGLPVRGQRTRCNARTRKGKAVAVGGLKLKVTKK